MNINNVGKEKIKLDAICKKNNADARHEQDLLQHFLDICRTIPAGTHGSTPHLLKTIVRIKKEGV